jgi:DNA-binding transcriptional ArsR family regulator
MHLNIEAILAVKPIGDLETLRVIVDSQRHRILTALIAEELGASALAERLKLPRTRIYYHLDLLERHGFVRVTGYHDEGAPVRLYRATAASFQLDRGLLGDQSTSVNDTRATLLEAAAADLRSATPSDDDVSVRRHFLRLNTERRAALQDAIAELLAQYVGADADGEDVEFISALFPMGIP